MSAHTAAVKFLKEHIAKLLTAKNSHFAAYTVLAHIKKQKDLLQRNEIFCLMDSTNSTGFAFSMNNNQTEERTLYLCFADGAAPYCF
jgi:hypothetical protein